MAAFISDYWPGSGTDGTYTYTISSTGPFVVTLSADSTLVNFDVYPARAYAGGVAYQSEKEAKIALNEAHSRSCWYVPRALYPRCAAPNRFFVKRRLTHSRVQNVANKRRFRVQELQRKSR